MRRGGKADLLSTLSKPPLAKRSFPQLNALVVGVSVDRETRRERISRRLRERLEQGLVDEVRALLDRGITAEQLIYYGLEYKFLTLYLTGNMKYDDMVRGLEIAIHQFAKRQMTWFRGMEKRGVHIRWVDASLERGQLVEQIKRMLYE